MPRRIRLLAEELSSPVSCSLCGTTGQRVYQRFLTSNYGRELSEFRTSPESSLRKGRRKQSCAPQPGGIGYRHWLGLIENSTEGNTARQPAKVVEQFRSLAREDGRLWAFGYDMDNMKARCWYDATMPILAVPKGFEKIFKALVEQIVRGALWVSGVLRGRVKDALFGDGDARGDLSFCADALVKSLRDVLSDSSGEQSILETWLYVLRDAALAIFDQFARSGDFDAADPRRIATARNDLSKALNGKKLRDVLGLPHPTRKAA